MYPPYDPLVTAELAAHREEVSVHFAQGAWIRQRPSARRRVRTGTALRRISSSVLGS